MQNEINTTELITITSLYHKKQTPQPSSQGVCYILLFWNHYSETASPNIE